MLVVVSNTVTVVHAQHLENHATGKVNNTGTIRFRNDTGKYKNDAPYTNITNNVVQFEGVGNAFTDGLGNSNGATTLGHDTLWRVPGLVRYANPTSLVQNVQARYYSDLEMADSAAKWIPDSVFVGRRYTIFLSGPRTYNGTFFYDGHDPQDIMQEKELSGTTNRYHNMTLLNGTKNVRSGYEVRMDGVFRSDTLSPLFVEGDFTWGTHSYVYAPVTVWVGGKQSTGSGITELHANVEVQDGLFTIVDDGDTTIIFAGSHLRLQNNPNAILAMGRNSHLLVLGDLRNQYAALTNATYDTTSLVNYAGVQSPQIMQATSAANPYGRLRTEKTVKNSNGDVFIASWLSVNDTNVVMVPNTLSMTLGNASYTNNAEVVGAFRRVLTNARTDSAYVYNNSETTALFVTIPQELTMDVRPQNRPNDYDSTTDVFRKITVTHVGDWKATIRAGYKATDIPTTWATSTSERLLKLYNAYPAPNESSIKLTPTVPPSYIRRPLSQSTGLAFVELFGIENKGADNLRLDNGNDLLLRASRDVLKAVASGRWSNPFTWDEAREPEPEDRVVIDGFTVHTGYIRANDNYAVREAYPDSMAKQVTIGASVNSALLFGYESAGVWDTFSLVPNSNVTLTTNRIAPTFVSADVLDQTAADIDGGLIIYRMSNFTTPNLVLSPSATVVNAGTLLVGLP